MPHSLVKMVSSGSLRGVTPAMANNNRQPSKPRISFKRVIPYEIYPLNEAPSGTAADNSDI